jgi:predicted RNA polymerase sigma factor
LQGLFIEERSVQFLRSHDADPRARRLVEERIEGEVTGLLALLLPTGARRRARTAADGSLVPLDEQGRARWDAAAVAGGVALVTDALSHGPVGPYQLQAAIAAVHDEAPTAETTDWPQILALYTLLERAAELTARAARLSPRMQGS